MISVIIPVYNIPANYLIECLNSVTKQSYKDLEIIIVNDCSPNRDNDIIIRRFAKLDDRIKYIKLTKNSGVSNARNIAMKNASGSWITFVDADDKLLPHALESMLDASIKYNAELVICNVQYDIDINARRSIIQEQKNEVCLITGTEQTILEAIRDFKMSIWGKLYKRDLLDNRYFPTDISHFEDYILLWHIVKDRVRYVISDEIGYEACYRESSAARAQIDIKKCERLLIALGYCCDQIQQLFEDMPHVKRFLSMFVLRESFAYRYMFCNLKREESIYIYILADKLFEKLNQLGQINYPLKCLIQLRLRLLKIGVNTNFFVFPLTRLFYRLHAI